MVENLQSKIKTHSAIFLKGTDRIYESEAINKRLKNPKNSFSFLSPYLAIKNNSEFLKNYFEKYFYNYDYIFNNETSAINFKVKFINEEEKEVETHFPLEVLYGMLFRYIKVISDKYYKENFNQNSDNKYYKEKSEIEYCFVTVPSFYSYKQRLAIIHAVSLSSMKLLGILNDNIAASFYFYKRNFDIKNYKINSESQDIYFIYINIGSSYTQLSLISYNKNEMKSIGEIYDKDLGGHLFTRNLVYKICDIVGIDKNKLDVNLYNKIFPYAFKYKETLSANKELHINFAIDDKSYKGILTRDDFNEINKEDFNKIPKLLDELFKQTNKTIKDINQFELIGGSIRIPEIQNIIRDYVGEENNELVGTHLNGDDSIAIGAAYAIRWRKKINEGINFNISMELNSLENNKKVNRTIVFEKGTPLETKKKIGIITDQNLNMDIYENDDLLMSCSFTKVNKEVKDFIKSMSINKNATYTKIPKVEFEFYISRLGIISLNAQLIFNVRTYIGLNISNNTGTIYNSLDYIEPISENEKQEIKNKLNETLNPNITYSEKDLLNKKLKKGTFFDKDIPVKLDFKITDYEPKSLTEKNLNFWRKKLNFYDKREKEEIKIIELRNELESLIYEKQNFLESDNAKEYTKNSEYSYLEKLISDTKNWFEDEGSFTRNISLLNDKIELIKNEFGKVDYRISIKKERDLEIEKFLIEIKNNQKKYIKEYKKSKPWTEFFYDEEYLPRIQELNNTLNEKIKKQNKIKSYEEPILFKEDIELMHKEVIDLFQKMINIPVPVHPPKHENIKLEDLYDFLDMI
jgi:hypoxia up-regulated 1